MVYHIGVTQLHAQLHFIPCQEEVMSMNKPKCDDLDYIHFLIATQRTFTCTETARFQPQTENAPPHDAFTHLLQRQPLNIKAVVAGSKGFRGQKKGPFGFG